MSDGKFRDCDIRITRAQGSNVWYARAINSEGGIAWYTAGASISEVSRLFIMAEKGDGVGWVFEIRTEGRG